MDRTTNTTDHALDALTAAATKAAAHPGVAAPLRELLPALVAVLEHQAQELRELRRPCPCEEVERRDGGDFPTIGAEALAVIEKAARSGEVEAPAGGWPIGGDGFLIPAGA